MAAFNEKDLSNQASCLMLQGVSLLEMAVIHIDAPIIKIKNFSKMISFQRDDFIKLKRFL